MPVTNILQPLAYLVLLLLLSALLGPYLARVYTGRSRVMDRLMGPLERLIYRIGGIDASRETGWKSYALSALLFSLAGVIAVYLLQRCQQFLPFNPQQFGPVTSDSAFNTATSFVTNTNWQGYGGETTMSYLTQMLGLTVQNFVSAATAMAVVAALIRGFARRSADTIGNFWVDMVRSTLHVLLPLSIGLALVLVSQGTVQTLDKYPTATLLQPTTDASGAAVTEQILAVGPAASQIAIKHLGTNGGGFFNANSAHPYENPNPLTNLLQMLAILVIPGALCIAFGKMVGDVRQGWALLAVMTLVLVLFTWVGLVAEQAGNPVLARIGADQSAGPQQSGGNMEGKEARFGISSSTIFVAVTTAASCGAVNGMHDSLTPLGGMVPMVLMGLGEVIFGGVGSGLYGLLVFAIVAVFMAGLMVGRTPEYLGKKIESYEMKMAALVILVPASAALIGAALALLLPAGRATIFNAGPHGFSEVLYAFLSASNNNGSAFAGLGANTPFYNVTLGLCMFFGRFWTMIPVLAIAGSLARKKLAPAGAGTLATHTPLFVILLSAVVLIVGALTFIPALALGPIVEHLQLHGIH